MNRASSRLRTDAFAIWRAGVDAVDSERLVRSGVSYVPGCLTIAGRRFGLGAQARIIVVGAGKAGAGMAAGFEAALAGTPALARVSGWVNVPSDCVRDLGHIHLHAARPAGLNEPTADGVAGSQEILRLVSDLSRDDICVVLLSGGGSALLPAPLEGISLTDKQAVTRFLMEAGASIQELNCVRKHLSRIKGGGLADAARGAQLIALVISDVVGDPLDVIASGPTVADRSTAADALRVLETFDAGRAHVPRSIWSVLEEQGKSPDLPAPDPRPVNVVIGNNAAAVSAAEVEARRLGYQVRSLGSDNQGVAREAGREIGQLCRSIRDADRSLPGPVCILSGGEPTVRLVRTAQPRKGGRNQELVLAAVDALWDDGMRRIAILSGGTDGEDGPTDAAGAVADADLVMRAKALGLFPDVYLAVNNSYTFFQEAGGLLKTGPTQTNVMDVRVALIAAS